MKTRIHPVPIPFQLPINAEKKTDRIVMSYVLLGERTALVDTGPAGGELRILAALVALGRTPADLSLVINTHEHPDHIGGNTFFQETVHPEFACHAEAVRWIETLDIQSRERPIYAFNALAGPRGVPVGRKLADKEVIALGGELTLEVIFCPGHSPGSIALFCPQEGVLIAGDTVQPVDGLPLYLDLARTRRSLERLRGLAGVEKMYLAWVEKPFTGEAIDHVFQDSLDYLDRVDGIVKEVVRARGPTAPPEEITREVLIRLHLDPPPVMPITMASIMSHLAAR